MKKQTKKWLVRSFLAIVVVIAGIIGYAHYTVNKTMNEIGVVMTNLHKALEGSGKEVAGTANAIDSVPEAVEGIDELGDAASSQNSTRADTSNYQ